MKIGEWPRNWLNAAKIRHGLFLAHLALEKTLKAHVCRTTGELAPKTHNLVRLAEMAGCHELPRFYDA